MDSILALVLPGESLPFLFKEIFLRKLSPQVQSLITQETEIKAANSHFLSSGVLANGIRSALGRGRAKYNDLCLYHTISQIFQTYSLPLNDTSHFHHRPPPHSTQPRTSSIANLAIAKANFDNMETLGIIHRSNNLWFLPLHVAPISNRGYRPCGDYHYPNADMTPGFYPVSNIQDFSV